MPKTSSSRKSKSGKKSNAGKKGSQSKKNQRKSKVETDYSKPVWWKKEDVSKPQDWYERAYGENYFSPNSSTTDIYGKKRRSKKRSSLFPQRCSFTDTSKKYSSSNERENGELSSSEEPADEEEVSSTESSSADVTQKRGTILNSLTEDEIQNVAEEKLMVLREEYVCQTS